MILALVVILSSFSFEARVYANAYNFRWLSTSTMDELLNVITNNPGNNEIFLQWDLGQTGGTYKLGYHLKDGTYTEATFQVLADRMNITYGLFERDNAGNYTASITEEEYNQFYSEMDYTALVPGRINNNINYDNNTNKDVLRYTIMKQASAQYPGVVFNLNNTEVRVRWNIQNNTISFLTKGVDDGKIIPFTLTPPSGGQPIKLNVLKNFEDFAISPSHWVEENGTLVNKKNITLPNDDDEIPGGRPGMSITFKQPKVWDGERFVFSANQPDTTATLIFNEVSGSGFTDFSFKLGGADRTIINPPVPTNANANVGKQYNYDSTTGTYTIEIVKDAANMGNHFLEWEGVEASRIYISQLSLTGLNDYSFKPYYEPVTQYGYTYVEYKVERASMENAFLDIKPYAGSDDNDLKYTIYQNATDPGVFEEPHIFLEHYHSGAYGESNIYVPVPFQENRSEVFYQVGVTFANQMLRSQTVKYTPENDRNVPPPTPRMEDVESLKVVPAFNEGDDPAAVQFDLEWTAPNQVLLEELLADGKLYYELYIHNQPSESDNRIKVFEVALDNGDIVVKEIHYDPTQPLGAAMEGSNYIAGYNQNTQTFGVKDIILKDSNGWSKLIEAQPSGKEYMLSQGLDYYFDFPGVYFLRMRAVYLKDDAESYSEKSVPVSLSLDTIRYDIPIPTGLSAYPDGDFYSGSRLPMVMQWQGIDIGEYKDYMLEPLGLKIQNEKIQYKWYLSTEEEALYTLDNVNEIAAIELGDSIDASDILPNLRNGEVINSSVATEDNQSGNINFKLENLDPNQRYYLRLKVEISIEDENGDVETRESMWSEVLTFVTPIIPIDPGSDSILPLAPEDLNVDFYEGSELESVVEWYYPDGLVFDEGKQAFEIVVLRDRSLPENLRGRGLTFQEVMEGIQGLNLDYKVYRLYWNDNTGVYELIQYQSPNAFVNVTDQILEVFNNRIRIIDEGLAPNSIYYYHVRTVNLEGNAEVPASNWVLDTLTTLPISPPINLVIPRPSPYYLDEKREVVVRFDVPFAYADRGSYGIEIEVKGEEDTDYTSNYSYYYVGHEEEMINGYTRMYYRISGLKPGQSYSIRVRIEDRTKPEDAVEGYPKSSYSERVIARTDFDQADYDKNQRFEEYIRYYENKVEELKNTDYWVYNVTSKTMDIKYRGEKVNNKVLRGTQYELYAEDKESIIYYLPGDMVEKLNNNQITMMIKAGMESIGVRSSTVSANTTKEIQNIKKSIQAYGSTNKDYYVLIEIRRGSFNGTIAGQKPISNLVDVKLHVVPSKVTEMQLETDILLALDQIANSYVDRLIRELEVELATGINDEKLNAIVNAILKDVQESHQKDVARLMNNSLISASTPIQTIQQPIYVAWQLDNTTAAISGYYRNGTVWENVGVTRNLGQYYLNAEKPGSYILVPNQTFGNVYDQKTLDLINKYSLTDFFMASELKQPTFKPKKQQVMDALARVLGAPKGADAIQWLNGYGITVNRSNLNQTMTKDSAFEILLKTYEKNKNRSLKNVSITNYNMVKDLNQVNSQNRSNILAGAHLKLVPLKDGYLSPQESITLQEFLNYLTLLQ
jgi:hypothetical protein